MAIKFETNIPLQFETNIPLQLAFPFGDFREVSSHYGQQFAYSVDLNGERDKLFATAGLHHKLQEAGVKAGSIFTITKIEVDGNRKEWRIEGGTAVKPPAPEHPAGQGGSPNGNHGNHGKPAPAPATGSPPVTTADGAASPESEAFQAVKEGLATCLEASHEIWQRMGGLPFTTEDVRTLGITLFLECSRKGIVPQVPAGDGLPF